MVENQSSRWRWFFYVPALVLIPAFSLLVASRPRPFERLFLRTVGGVIEGVQDHLGAWVAGFVVVVIVVWAAIGVGCLIEWRRDRKTNS